MNNEMTVALLTAIAMIIGGVIAKLGDLFIAKNRNKIDMPSAIADASKADAEADRIRAEYNYRTIQRLDDENKHLIERVGILEVSDTKKTAIIDAMGRTIKRLENQVALLKTQLHAAGIEPADVGPEAKA